ncbi:hypothetical protein HNQ69_001085 [Bartonella callosciuri]|uniref:Uncharacterized protein n=1 Tax=Bartonella callosciuri TaxID=686223 RepID=A0A840NXB2_9HYPH|nr:hypothetical protein [Bartonella callosciuri]MBB5073952.1 hypothetical protein [Bartonella callosciuri]
MHKTVEVDKVATLDNALQGQNKELSDILQKAFIDNLERTR